MDKDVFKGQPVNFGLKDMLEVAASAHVEIVALRTVVDMIIRVKVAHADLDGTGEHGILRPGGIEESFHTSLILPQR